CGERPGSASSIEEIRSERGAQLRDAEAAMKYLATIGLQVHVQLKTRSKMFCASPVEFGATPNTHTCPVCLGLPGALPVMNQEADVAKSFHFEAITGIDFNRAGTPLMEIVTQPEINSPEEAFAFLTSLKQILIYGAVSDADMEKGQLRCDCNVSVWPEKQAGL